jgi:hypothetical protein
MTEETKTPNPGSDEAIAIGCKCPVLDNGHGDEELAKCRGGFWINAVCPIHGTRKEGK